MSGLAAIQVPKVIRMCARAFGIEISDIPSPRSIGRFVLEGGAAAKVQVGDIIAQAHGVTMSMDSTSQRSINFSSMHLMANSPGVHKQLYLAVESTTDHTSKTQVKVLRNTIDAICDTTGRAPKGKSSPEAPICTGDIARKLYGANGDHANDQRKVAQLEKEWKIDSWVEYLGTSASLSLEGPQAEVFYQSIQKSAEASAGGANIFSSLAPAAQEDLHVSEYQKHVWTLGNTAFNAASPALKLDMSCVVRGGCCAHKDMNASKGGAFAMSGFWKSNQHLSPPVKLFNKDNDATVLLANPCSEMSDAEQRAIMTTESGAIKLCSLAGAAYNHKDDKKGHQDSHAYWFAAKHNRFHRFPDTSNIRYSSYIDAATELCTFQGAYIDYMEHSRRKKATGTLNHLESNILKALNCPATLSELLVISLYGQAVSKPYMRLVRRATIEGKGIADLGLLHSQVQHHLETMITNPSIILDPKALAASATLDGSEWDNPAVITALRSQESQLPWITDLFVVFCQGALQAWARFTDEYGPNGALSSLTLEQHEKAFMPPTNDANEGALGTWRVWTRRFPSLTLHRSDAIAMNRANHTESYIDANFTPEQHIWARSEARRIDSSKLEETRKTLLVSAAIEEAERNQQVRLQRSERRQKRELHLANIQLVLDPQAILKLKGTELNDQLKVYKQSVVLSGNETFPAISKLNVEDKRRLVTGLALQYIQGLSGQGTTASESTL